MQKDTFARGAVLEVFGERARGGDAKELVG